MKVERADLCKFIADGIVRNQSQDVWIEVDNETTDFLYVGSVMTLHGHEDEPLFDSVDIEEINDFFRGESGRYVLEFRTHECVHIYVL